MRAAATLAIAVTLAGCAPPPMARFQPPSLVLDPAPDPAPLPTPAAVAGAAERTAPLSTTPAFAARAVVHAEGTAGSAPVLLPAPPSPGAATVGGQRGDGGARPAAGPPASTAEPGDEGLIGPDGRLHEVDATRPTVPAGQAGLWTYVAAGLVPSSIELDGSSVATLHPRALAASPEPRARAVVVGVVEPGAFVAWTAPGRRDMPGTRAGTDGAFHLEVPLAGAEAGALVAAAGSRRGLVPARLVPEETLTAPALALAGPAPGLVAPPDPPAGMAVADAAVLALVTVPDCVTPVRLWSGDPAAAAPPPRYELPGVEQALAFVALAPDGLAGSAISGPPDALPPFLAPPDLAGLPARLEAGAELAWPPVAGARAYGVKLTSAAGEPLWEAALGSPRVRLPVSVAPEARVTLEVVAWDVAGLTTYSLAGLRALRLPEGPAVPVGRRSWAIRTFGGGTRVKRERT